MDKDLEARIAGAKDRLKAKEVLSIGAKQLKTSEKSKYLSFKMAVELTKKRWSVRFAPIDLTELEHNWKRKYGHLEFGQDEHEIDPNDGFCFTCAVFHSGDEADTIRFLNAAPFAKEVEKTVVCTNTFLEDDGFCNQCGRNHNGGEREAKGDEKVIAAMDKRPAGSPWRDLKDVEAKDLRVDTKLWKLGEIAQIDSEV